MSQMAKYRVSLIDSIITQHSFDTSLDIDGIIQGPRHKKENSLDKSDHIKRVVQGIVSSVMMIKHTVRQKKAS